MDWVRGEKEKAVVKFHDGFCCVELKRNYAQVLQQNLQADQDQNDAAGNFRLVLVFQPENIAVDSLKLTPTGVEVCD